ncbi:MAG: ATP-binding protein [bacterium]|nr:ATP-binding protein [bacterium]
MDQQNKSQLQVSDVLEEKIKSLEEVSKAMLNILEDFNLEKLRFEETQRASFNILEDFNAEKLRLEDTERATLNILDDFNGEKSKLEETQKATLNILEDFNAEKLRLEDTERATLNILEDFNEEKSKLEETQKATLNILEDFDTEKMKVETANLTLSNEIGERRQAEERIKKLNEQLESDAVQLEAANKGLETFSYSVSHDLRGPLRAIDGFSRILMQDYMNTLDDEGKRLLTIVSDNTRKMGQLIDDILSFSRVGRKEIGLTEINMEKLAKDVLGELNPATDGRKIEIEVMPLPNTHADISMIRQVLVNLLSNAIKFTKPGAGALIEIGCNPGVLSSDKEGKSGFAENVYYVKDNGVGFDMTYESKLFGVFQRLHGADEFEGTGIGLAIVKRVIDRHGGRVWAEGKINEGATFYFALPGIILKN